MDLQLKDDLLDVYGETDKLGKLVGGDIISNKKTFLLINALGKANDEQLIELKSWISLKEFDPGEKVKAVMDIYSQTGIRKITEDKMNEFFIKGYNNLELIGVNDDRKSDLKTLIDFLVSREK
ncbi:polyprenyl synthetase family protein [Bacteroidota bacterium]